MSLAFFRSFSSPAKKVTLNAEKSDLSLLWECHCSPMRKNNNYSSCSTPKSKQSEINFLNLLIATKPQTPTKTLYCPPQHNNLILPKSPSRLNNDTESLNSNEFIYSRISLTTDKTLLIPDEIKEFISYVYSPSSNRGESEFHKEAWDNFKNNNSKTSRCCVVSSATFAFLFENEEDSQTKVHVKSFTGTAQQQIRRIIQQDDENSEEDLFEDNDFIPIDYEKAVDLIESISSKEKINIFSTDPFHYSVVMPLTFKHSEFESSQGKMFRVLLSGYIFPYQARQLVEEKSKYNLFKISKFVLY